MGGLHYIYQKQVFILQVTKILQVLTVGTPIGEPHYIQPSAIDTYNGSTTFLKLFVTAFAPVVFRHVRTLLTAFA